MSASHDQIQLEIPAYIAGRLDEVTSRRLEDHLAVCTECEAAVIDGETIVRALRSTEGTSEDVRLDEVRSHLFAVSRRRLADRAPTPPTRWMIPLSIGSALGAAACLVITLLLGWGPESTPGGLQQPRDPIQWLLLESSTRGSAGPKQLSTADHNYLPVGVVISLDSLQAMPDPVEFSIADESGEMIWTARVDRARLERDLRSMGFISFLLPASDYPAGQYRLRVEGFDLPFDFRTTSSRDGE